jgi:hypothetical protein
MKPSWIQGSLIVATLLVGCSEGGGLTPEATADATVDATPQRVTEVDPVEEPPSDISGEATEDTPSPADDVEVQDTVTPWDAPPGDPGPCQCQGPTHCNEEGACAQDLCEKGATTCANLTSQQHCDADGSSATVESCFPGQVCSGGDCVDPICEPNSLGGCDGTGWLACNSLGTAWVTYTCPLDSPCQAGACRPVEPNVLLLIDTSGSMNWKTNGESVQPCVGVDCDASWSFPNCDDPQDPVTRLGRVKQALNTVVQSEAAGGVRLALQRFPQRPFEPDAGFFGGASGAPECDGGYWVSTDEAMITGDEGQHFTSLDSWFGANLSEVLLYPFEDATNLGILAQWFDFKVETVTTETPCEDASVCAGGPCVLERCLTTTNPELRGGGPTPIGKSLFYAGEYLRHTVLIEGKQCITDDTCGSPHHSCEDGVCHDPYGHCRDHIIIVFTDGAETRNVATSDFFNPRVQAKRLHFGLGCSADTECLSGATCVDGVCRAPGAVADASALICDAGEVPCTSDNQCEDPCENWGDCPGGCAPTEPLMISDQGAQHLTDQQGNPVSVRVHVVDASGIAGNNSLVATFGGGQYFDVNLDNPEELVASVYEILGDTKDTTPCAAD